MHIPSGENPLMFTQVIIRKRKTDGRTTDRLTDGQTHGRLTWNHNTRHYGHYCVAGYKKTKDIYRHSTRLNLVHPQPLRKHAYSNILKILQPKPENFQIKNSDIFHISAQNIDCGYSLEPPRRGGSNEYPQSMFLSRNKKIMYTPVLLYKSGV